MADASYAPIKKQRGTALHHQIFLLLRDRILNGQEAAGQPLPSEEEFARLFGVSRVTVRSAMASLDAEGLIERRQGAGTFAASRGLSAPLHVSAADLLAHITHVDRTTTLKLLEFDVVKASPSLRASFQCDRDATFQRAVRVRSAGRKPMFYVTTLIPMEIARDFSREDMESTSLYKLLARSGIPITSGKQVVSAQLADPAVAVLLKVAVGSPLIQIRRHHFDQNGKAVEYIEVLTSPEVFELHMEIDPEQLSGQSFDEREPQPAA